MTGSSPSGITELLAGLREKKESPTDELFEEVYGRLRQLARGQRKRWKGDLSLQTTALAHEAYLELIGPEERSWESRSHFFAVAARAMRHILIDRARRKRAEKRGGDARLLSLEDLKTSLGREGVPSDEGADRTVTEEEAAELLVMVGEALDRFEEDHPRAARVVESRFFGGMTIKETAEALDVSPSTVSRDWKLARGWLYREMKRLRGGGVVPKTEAERS